MALSSCSCPRPPPRSPFHAGQPAVPVDAAKSSVSTDAAGRVPDHFGRPRCLLRRGHAEQLLRTLSRGRLRRRSRQRSRQARSRSRAVIDVRGVDIALPPSLAIEGRVLDESRRAAVADVCIRSALMPGSDSAERVPSLATLTDDLGPVSDLWPRGRHLSRRRGRARRRDMFFEPVEGRAFTSVTVQQEPEPFHHDLPSVGTRADAEGQQIRLAAQDVTADRHHAPARTAAAAVRNPARFPGSAGIDQPPAGAQTRTRHVRRPASFMPMTRAASFCPRSNPGEYRLLVGPGLASGLAFVNGRTEFAEMPLTIATDMPDLVVVTQPGIGLAGQVVFAEGPPASPPKMRIAFRKPETSSAEQPRNRRDDGRRVPFLRERRLRCRSWCGSPSCQRDG